MEVQVELDRATFRRLLKSALTERRSVGDQAEVLLRDALRPPARGNSRGGGPGIDPRQESRDDR